MHHAGRRVFQKPAGPSYCAPDSVFANTVVKNIVQKLPLIISSGLAMNAVYGTSYTTAVPDIQLDEVPDLREEESRLKLQKGDFVIVPIPISDPTLGSGLVLGGAYFYPQTEAQAAVQPASLTGVAGLYTSNDSYAFGVGQQNYWDEDRWRFSGALGYLNFELSLIEPSQSGDGSDLDWLVEGQFAQAEVSRNIYGNWYLGAQGRYVDSDQTFSIDIPEGGFDFLGSFKSVGLGLSLEFDTRDVPTNAYKGQYFEVDALFNSDAIGSTDTYQSYDIRYRSYHQLAPALVLAWEIKGCRKSGQVPLWDACRISLRGFPATDYMSRSSLSSQVEARWQFHRKWGVVAFAGGGFSETSLSAAGDNEAIPSYGAGLRFMVLESKRINMRLDYGRSDDSDAWYLAVTEAF